MSAALKMKYYGRAYTQRPLEGSLTERLKILGCFIPFGVTGRVLELVPAAYRQRQDTPLNESWLIVEPYMTICVPRGCSQGVLAPHPTTPYSALRLELRTFQSPTDWAAAAQD